MAPLQVILPAFTTALFSCAGYLYVCMPCSGAAAVNTQGPACEQLQQLRSATSSGPQLNASPCRALAGEGDAPAAESLSDIVEVTMQLYRRLYSLLHDVRSSYANCPRVSA
jgi:hypothetical protein